MASALPAKRNCPIDIAPNTSQHKYSIVPGTVLSLKVGPLKVVSLKVDAEEKEEVKGGGKGEMGDTFY